MRDGWDGSPTGGHSFSWMIAKWAMLRFLDAIARRLLQILAELFAGDAVRWLRQAETIAQHSVHIVLARQWHFLGVGTCRIVIFKAHVRRN